MATNMSYIQTGWTVRTSDGQDLGTVVELSPDTIFVGGEDERRSIPKSFVDEEDEEAQLAILAVDAETIEEGSYSR